LKKKKSVISVRGKGNKLMPAEMVLPHCDWWSLLLPRLVSRFLLHLLLLRGRGWGSGSLGIRGTSVGAFARHAGVARGSLACRVNCFRGFWVSIFQRASFKYLKNFNISVIIVITRGSGRDRHVVLVIRVFYLGGGRGRQVLAPCGRRIGSVLLDLSSKALQSCCSKTGLVQKHIVLLT
jgi:hypothetical protein